MDDIKSLSAAWCEEARGLTGAADQGPADRHAHQGRESSPVLTARLDSIGEGIRLRRKLDGLVPDEEGESGRREVVCLLAELQSRARTCRVRRDDPPPQVATRVKEWLVERVAARNAQTVLQFEPLHQAMALEAARGDLEWFSAVVSRLDNEAPPSPAVWLDGELERLRCSLSPPDARHADPRDEPVRARCEWMKAGLLERRVRRAGPADARGSGRAAWVQRFQLSRLQRKSPLST